MMLYDFPNYRYTIPYDSQIHCCCWLLSDFKDRTLSSFPCTTKWRITIVIGSSIVY